MLDTVDALLAGLVQRPRFKPPINGRAVLQVDALADLGGNLPEGFDHDFFFEAHAEIEQLTLRFRLRCFRKKAAVIDNHAALRSANDRADRQGEH